MLAAKDRLLVGLGEENTVRNRDTGLGKPNINPLDAKWPTQLADANIKINLINPFLTVPLNNVFFHISFYLFDFCSRSDAPPRHRFSRSVAQTFSTWETERIN